MILRLLAALLTVLALAGPSSAQIIMSPGGGSGGGGTQYPRDTAAGAADQMNMCGVVRKDTTGTLVDTDGDRSLLQVDANGRLVTNGSGVTQPVSGTLTCNAGSGTFAVSGTVTANQGTAAGGSGAWPVTVTDTSNTVVKPGDAANNAVRVNIVAGAGSGGTSSADGAAYSAGSTTGTPMMGARDDASPGTVAEDKLGIVRITTNRAAHVNLRDASGNELLLPAALDADGGFKVHVQNGGSGGTAMADDAAFTPGTTSITPVGGTYRSTLDAVDDGDGGAFAMTQRRAVHVRLTKESDGSEIGTSSQPVRVDPTGTTTQPVSISGNQATNTVQLNGTTVDVNSGNKSAGTQRVVLATDQPQLTNALKVDGSAVTQPVSGTVTAQQSTASSLKGQMQLLDTGGTNVGTVKAASTAAATTDTSLVVQPSPLASPICTSFVAISQTASTKLVTGVSAKRVYICSLVLVAGAAEIVSLSEGTGSTCGTGSAAIMGSTTTANGMSFAANGGVSMVVGTPFLKTATDADDVCLLQNGSNRVSGFMTYVIQ